MNTYLTTAALLIVLVTLNCASGAPGGSRSSSSSHLDIDAMIDPLQPSSAEDPKESQLAQRSLFNFRVFCKEGEQHVNGRCVPVFKSSGAGGSEAAALQLAHSYYQRNKTTRKPSRRRPQGTGEVPTTTTATTDPTTTTTTIPPTTTTLTPEIHTAPTTPIQGPHYQIVTSASANSPNSVTHGFVAPSTPEFVHELDIIQTTYPATTEEHVHHHHSSHHHHHHHQQPILTSPTPNFETTTAEPEANPTSLPSTMRPSLLEEVPTTTSNPTIIKGTDIEDEVPETTMMPSMSETEVFETDSEVPNTSLPNDQGPNMASTLPPAVVQEILEEAAEELQLAEGSTMRTPMLSETEATGDTTEAEAIVPAPLPQRGTAEVQTAEQQPQNNQPGTTPPTAAPQTTQVFHVFPETTSEPPVHPAASIEPSTVEDPLKVSWKLAEKLSTTTSTPVTHPTPTPPPSFTTTTTRQPPRPSTPTSSVFRFPEEESDDYIDETSTETHAHPAFQPTPSSATSAPLASIFWEPVEVDKVLVPKPRSDFRDPIVPQGSFLKPPSGHIRFDADSRGRPEVPRSLVLAPAPSQFLQPAADRRTQLMGGLAPALSDYPTYPSFTAHEHFRFPVSTINTVASEGPSRAESERRSRQLFRQFG